MEKLNVWDAYSQACENSNDYEPIVVMKKNGKTPLVVVDAEYFMKIHQINPQKKKGKKWNCLKFYQYYYYH